MEQTECIYYCRIRLERLVPLCERKEIMAAEDVCSLIKPILEDGDREHLVAIALDQRNRVSAVSTISVGTADHTLFCCGDILKVCILSNASYLIVAHNHPSGACFPSRLDILSTKELQTAADLVGVTLVDHIIVGDGCHYSFLEHNLVICEKKCNNLGNIVNN